MQRTTIRTLALRRHHLSTAAANAPGLGVSMAAASDFARRHGTLATILGGVLSASVLTAVAVTHKDTALARTREELGKELAHTRGELGKELAAKDAVLARTREELGIALARMRGEFDKELAAKDTALARTRGEFDKELAAKDTALARTREELGVSIARAEGHMDAKILDLLMHGDYAKAREQLLEIKGRVRAGGSDSTAP